MTLARLLDLPKKLAIALKTEKKRKRFFVSTYLEDRIIEIKRGEYPKNHYWGIDSIIQNSDWTGKLLNTSSFKIPSIVESLLDYTIFRGSPGAKIEFTALKASRHADLIYSVCGPLCLARLYRNKLVSWTFRDPLSQNTKSKLAHKAYKPPNLLANAGFLCLTPVSERKFKAFATSKFVPGVLTWKSLNLLKKNTIF